MKLPSRVLRHEHSSKLLNSLVPEINEKNIQVNEGTLVKTKFLQTKQRNKSPISRLRRL